MIPERGGWVHLHSPPKHVSRVPREQWGARERHYYQQSKARYDQTDDAAIVRNFLENWDGTIAEVSGFSFYKSPEL